MGLNFPYILSAFFFTEFGRAMYFIVISWVLYNLTKDPSYTGLLVGLGFVPGLFLNMVIGVVIDRFDRKKLALFANLIITVAMLLALIAIGTGAVEVWMIVSVHMLMQLTGSLYRPSLQAFVTEAFKKEQLPKIFSQSGAASELGSMLGSSIGGLIVAYLSTTASMATVVFCYILATIALLLTKYETVLVRGNKKVTVVSDLVGGFTYLKDNKFLLGLFAMMFVGQLVFHTSMGFLSVYVTEYLHKPVQIYGLMDATISIGGIAAGFLGTWWWKKNGNSVATRSLIIIAIGLLCVGFAPALPVSFIGIFLIGIGTTWVRVLLQSVQQMATDPQYYGRMASYRMFCNQSAVAIGGPIMGLIALHHGVGNAYLALLIPAVGAVVFSIFQRKSKRFMNITETA